MKLNRRSLLKTSLGASIASQLACEQGTDAAAPPMLGDLKSARKSAHQVVATLAPRVREGLKVVVPGPTCSYQLKNEFPALLETSDAQLLADNTLDLGEYVFKVAAAKELDREFPNKFGKIAYQLPCHLKAQNIGFRSKQILGLVADEVEMIEACSGVDGTWGMKAQWYDESLKVCQGLTNAITNSDADAVATDCPLSALRIEEQTGRKAHHPIVLLRDAYGLEE